MNDRTKEELQDMLYNACDWILDHTHEDDLVRALRLIGFTDEEIIEITEV